MNKTNNILAFLAVASIVVIVAIIGLSQSAASQETRTDTSTSSSQDTNNSTDTDSETEGDNSSVVSNPGEFTDYNDALLARADSGDVVLFFAARWCTTCQALKRDINGQLDQIPENLTILELDYDTERDLKQKYGVVLQHTLVQVDSGGNKIKMWTGGNTLQSVMDKVT